MSRVRHRMKSVPFLRDLVLGARRILDPPRYAEFAISIYTGDSLDRLQPHGDPGRPVLSAADVTDMRALIVADPFMLRRDGKWFMFFEVLPEEGNKGVIALAESMDGFAWRYQKVVLAEPFHLSFPHVFEWEGEVYMIPESHQTRTVRLYRATRFPFEWTFERTLLTGAPFVDSSLLRHDDHWWLFTDGSPDLTCDHLHLFHSPELCGPWREHRASPILSQDQRFARPAGRVVWSDGRPMRFAQDCQPLYGLRIHAFKILELTADAYREEMSFGAPILDGTGGRRRWNGGGMHHVDPHPANAGGWIACVDGWRMRREPKGRNE